jgi:hypothetical protein
MTAKSAYTLNASVNITSSLSTIQEITQAAGSTAEKLGHATQKILSWFGIARPTPESAAVSKPRAMLWGTHDEVTTALKAVGGREAVSGKLLPDDTEHATTSRALWLVPDPQTNTGIAFSWLDMSGDLSANLHLKQHPAQDDSVLAMTAEFNPRGPENPMGGHQRGEWVTCEVKSLDNGSERSDAVGEIDESCPRQGEPLAFGRVATASQRV